MGVNFSQAWVNKSLCNVALSGRKRENPRSSSLLSFFSSVSSPFPKCCVAWTSAPHPLRKVNRTVAAVVGSEPRSWHDKERMLLAATYQGGGDAMNWANGPGLELRWRGPGQVASPPSQFPNKSPKFNPAAWLTSCPHRSPAPEAWFPPCRCGCPLRRRVWCWRRGSARPPLRCPHSPALPGYGWTRLSVGPTASPYRRRSWW